MSLIFQRYFCCLVKRRGSAGVDNVIRSRRIIVPAFRPCLFSKYTYMNQIIYFFMICLIEKLTAFWLYQFLMKEIIQCALVAGWFAKQNMFSIIKPSWLKTDSLFWSSSKRMHMANNDWRCKLQKNVYDSEFHPV